MNTEGIVSPKFKRIHIKTNQDIKSIEQLIREFYGLNGNPLATYYSNSLQCEAGRRRSFEDIYKLVKSYFPDATAKELLELLLNIEISGRKLTLGFCPTINKPIIFRSYLVYEDYYTFNTWYFNLKGKTAYSWRSLLSIFLGINSISELRKYLNKNKT